MSRAIGAIAAASFTMGALTRAWLLLRDDTASGYDAWYYVLQVRSIGAGSPLFDDPSALFGLLVLLTRWTGDAVLSQELAAAGFAALTAGLAAVAGGRLGGAPGAAVAGVAVVVSTGHFALSAEYLKNAAGAAPLMAALALLPGGPSLPRWGGALVCAALALALHKLCGALALVALAGAMVAGAARAWALPIGALAVAMAAGAGAMRGVDWARWGAEAGVGRAERLGSSSLTPAELAEVALAHGAVLVAPWAWARGADRPTVGALAALALACAAPGLPFSFEATSWRLLTMAFVAMSLLAAASRPSTWFAGLAVVVGLSVLPSTMAAHARRTPDYASWRAVLPTLRAALPSGARLVAHRGVCGFLWAEGGLHCENFAPVGDLQGWYRVVFGVEAAALARHGQVWPLRPGYALVHEPTWRAFVAAEPERRMTRDPRNPFEPRPAFVYGPKGAP
jgi:hypothetical protein